MSARRWILAAVVGLSPLFAGCASSRGTGSAGPPGPPLVPSPGSPSSPAGPTGGGSDEGQGEAADGRAPDAEDAGEGAEAEDQAAGADSTTQSQTESGSDAAVAGPVAATQEERRVALDGELGRSLSEFDEELRKEQEALGARRDEADGTRAESREARNAAGRAGAGHEGSGGSPDAPPRESGDTDEVGGREDDSQDDNGRVPADVGDGHDDDIVARQLREAAMKEEDPELREKLWEEYRRYKRGED